MSLMLDRDGAQLFPNLLNDNLLADLERILSSRPRQPGVRIRGHQELSDWISHKSPVGKLVSTCLQAEAQPVRAILFDKNPETNWALGWHQDRTIAVRERIGVEAYRNWTLKAGTAHVEPPFQVLERMITVRVHLDDVDSDNGPLLIVPGSHRLGRLVEAEIGPVVEAGGSVACLARAGDVWVYSTPILHSSEASRRATKRRVLQVDFSSENLPGGLRWAGIGSN